MGDDEKLDLVVLSSGKVNRYGYRLWVLGCKLANFIANPLMLFVHSRSVKNPERTEDFILPIGKWEDIEIKNGQLVARPVFDMEDPFAATIARKWKAGFLNATSVLHTFDKMSDDAMYLLEGQTRPTVIEWEPLEASIVDIGGDAEAVRFGLTGRGEDPLSILPLLNKNNNIDMDKVKMIALLGLAADATDADIEAKVAALNLSAATAKSILVQAALSLAKTKGLTAEKEAAFALMAESSPEMVIAMLNLLPTATPQSVPTPTPTTQTLAAALTTASLNQKPAPATGREAWTLTDWRKQDPNGLLALEKTNEGAFLALVEQSMKFKPQ